MKITCSNCKKIHTNPILTQGKSILCECGYRVYGERLVRSEAHRPPFLFFVDTMLGKLACYLRLLGFDTHWQRKEIISPLLEKSISENRIILTQNKILIEENNITDLILIQAEKPRAQLSELSRFYPLKSAALPFSRCSRCNTEIQVAERQALVDKIPHYVFKNHENFWECPMCQKIYWESSHLLKLYDFIEKSF